jgi:hypothetical protein
MSGALPTAVSLALVNPKANPSAVHYSINPSYIGHSDLLEMRKTDMMMRPKNKGGPAPEPEPEPEPEPAPAPAPAPPAPASAELSPEALRAARLRYFFPTQNQGGRKNKQKKSKRSKHNRKFTKSKKTRRRSRMHPK